MKIHHIGYAVKDIEASAKAFEKLGYVSEDRIFEDSIRKVRILFMKSGSYVIELVSPIGPMSPVTNIIKKIGNSCYHICYEVEDIELEAEKLVREGYLIVEPLLGAIALGNKPAIFLFGKDMGLVEIVSYA